MCTGCNKWNQTQCSGVREELSLTVDVLCVIAVIVQPTKPI